MSAEFSICLLLLLFLFFSLSAFATFEFDGKQNLTDGQFLGGQIKNLELLQTKFMDTKLMKKFLFELSKKQRILEALFAGEKKHLLRSDAFPPPFFASDEFECLKTKLSSIHANDPALSQLLNGLFAAEIRAKRKLESLAGFDEFSLLKELKKSVAFALLFLAKRRRIQLNKYGEKQHFDLSKESAKSCDNFNKNGRKGTPHNDEKFLRFAFRVNQIDLDEAALFNGLKDEKRRRRRKRMINSYVLYSMILAMFFLIIICLCFIGCHDTQNNSRNIHRNNGQTEANGAMTSRLATLAMNNKRYLDTFNGIPSVVVGAKKLSEEERTECAICLCQIDAGTKVKPLPICKHIFHNECIEMWIGGGHNGCPICRQEILDTDMLSITTANAPEQNGQQQQQTAIENDNDNSDILSENDRRA
ncbi:hypothetical protein niasHT_019444 [Heterodera trifolii]|uniref:RING-type domain-containing protein n=1 Tax=Heterodera trifolii TaxID=157864 RepID=A0ABD2KVU4_9BILA